MILVVYIDSTYKVPILNVFLYYVIWHKHTYTIHLWLKLLFNSQTYSIFKTK